MCVDGQTECRSAEHKSKALLSVTAIGLLGVGIKENEDFKAEQCYTQ